MTRAEDNSCRNVLKLVDAYLDGELLVETNAEVLEHLDRCPVCSAALAGRSRLRTALKRAVESEPVPSGLAEIVRVSPRVNTRGSLMRRWALAVVLLLAVLSGGLGVWILRPWESPETAQLRRTLAMAAEVHGNCPHDSRPEDAGGEYAGLAELIGEEMPSNFEISSANPCTRSGRLFVRLTLQGENGRVSFVVTNKGSDGLLPVGRVPAFDAGGVPVFSGRSGGYEVAGFETRAHMAFIVSDLPGDANLQLAAAIAELYAPSMRSAHKEAGNAY